MNRFYSNECNETEYNSQSLSVNSGMCGVWRFIQSCDLRLHHVYLSTSTPSPSHLYIISTATQSTPPHLIHHLHFHVISTMSTTPFTQSPPPHLYTPSSPLCHLYLHTISIMSTSSPLYNLHLHTFMHHHFHTISTSTLSLPRLPQHLYTISTPTPLNHLYHYTISNSIYLHHLYHLYLVTFSTFTLSPSAHL